MFRGVHGDIYEGNWKDGYYHGKGKYTYTNDFVYEGDWEYGRRHGQGRLYANGNVREGYWENDKRQKGTVVYQDRRHIWADNEFFG